MKRPRLVTGLRARLIAGFGLVALSGVLAVSLSANLLIESGFAAYVRERMAGQQRTMVRSLEDAWEMSGAWKPDELSALGMNSLENGFIIRVADSRGAVVWDARTHNNGMCQQMLAGMARNMDSRYPGWNGAYREESFPLGSSGAGIGTVWIGYYGPFYYNDTELFFLGSLNRIVAVTAALALLAACALGWLMARRLSAPLLEIGRVAHRLRQGGLDSRVEGTSAVREIADLADSVNSLAHSLGEQESLRRRLTGDVSHELRTPLTTLQGQLEAMIDGLMPADAARLESCREEVLRLSRLVGQIEGLARLEADGARLDLRTVALDSLVARACANFQAEYRARGVALDWQAEALSFRADPDKLTQILVNLLSNALKFTPPGGSVRVAAGRAEPVAATIRGAGPAAGQTSAGGTGPAGPQLCLSVTDSGQGIAAADLPHIFERFWRADPSRSRASGGAGIGLTIVAALVQLHGGTITVESSPGQGSRFEIRLPWRA